MPREDTHGQLIKYARDLNRQVKRLKQKNAELREVRDAQEVKVKERTADLEKSNSALRVQIRLRQIALKKNAELIGKLQSALEEVKTLSGLIPICAHCKNISTRTTAEFSHGICPDCIEEHYPKFNSKPHRQATEEFG